MADSKLQFNIPIDEIHYHTNLLSDDEILWGKATYRRLLTRYSKLNAFVNETVKPLNLNESGTEQLLTTVTIAFCHTIKNYRQPTTEAQMDKTLKSWLNSFLPYIVQNLLLCRYSHPIQFEPIATYCRYAVNSYQKAIIDLLVGTQMTELSEFESFFLCEFVNLLRAISSSITLFFSGDDVHGVSLYRGVMEISSKLVLAPKFSEEYVLFKNFNCYLQKKKQFNEPLPLEMVKYLENEPLYTKNPENFLAYGWAKDSRGKRILSMKQLVLSSAANEKRISALLQLTSELIHEDYVGIVYDYIAMRKKMIDYTYVLLRGFSCNETFRDLSPKLQKKISHLQSLTDLIYTGEIPLLKES